MTEDSMDVLIRAEVEDVEDKLRRNIDDKWSTKCYWSVSGTPQRTGRGQQAIFSDGEEPWGLANITGVEEGRIVFMPIHRLDDMGLEIEIDEEPPDRGFQYIDPEGGQSD